MIFHSYVSSFTRLLSKIDSSLAKTGFIIMKHLSDLCIMESGANVCEHCDVWWCLQDYIAKTWVTRDIVSRPTVPKKEVLSQPVFCFSCGPKTHVQYQCHHIYIYGNIQIYGLLNIQTGILDYLREGFPWPARPFKHTESNPFKHTVTTFKYTNWYFILPPWPRGLARPPHI